VKRTPMFRAAASALLLSFACTTDDVAHEGPPPEPAPAPTSELPKAAPSDDGPGSPGAPCGVDADCGAGQFCALRICIAGCPATLVCDVDEVCDPHGRCSRPDDDPTRLLAGTPELSDRLTFTITAPSHWPTASRRPTRR
jgi:hypothetical protein